MLSKNGICYKICNSTTVELTTEKYIEPVIESSKITQLHIGNELIKIGHVFKFPLGNRTVSYEVNHILPVNKSTFLLKTELRNKTTQYILPILEKINYEKTKTHQLDLSTVNDMKKYCYNSYLVNAYIGGEDINRIDGYLYLKMAFSPHDVFQMMEETIANSHPLFVKTIDQGDEFTYYKFRIPKEFKEDIYLFFEGRYSKFSVLMKSRITAFHSLKKESNMYQIITSGDLYREKLSKELGHPIQGELESIPESINELILI